MLSKKMGAALVLLSVTQAGCEGRLMPRSFDEIQVGNAPQSFELVIDGKPISMTMESGSTEHVAAADIEDGRVLSFTATDRKRDFMLTVAVALPPGGIAVRSYQSYHCAVESGCSEKPKQKERTSSLMPYLGNGIPDQIEVKSAYKAPALGLAPLTVTISSVSDSYALGVGGTKRIKGNFKGELVSLSTNEQGVEVVEGKPSQVEGKFDLNAYVTRSEDE